MSQNENASRRAAVVILGLGEEIAAELLQSLPPKDRKAILSALQNLKSVPQQEIDAEISRFYEVLQSAVPPNARDGADFARKLLERSHPEGEREALAREMGLDVPRFDCLLDVEPKALADLISQEHPQTAALIMAHVEPQRSGRVLAYLPIPLQTEILMRLAALESVQLDVLQELEEELIAKISQIKVAASRRVGGAAAVAATLSRAEAGVSAAQLAAIGQRDPALAESLRRLMFTFEDLARVQGSGIQLLLRLQPGNVWQAALRGAPAAITDVVFANMSGRACEMLRSDMEAAGPLKRQAIEEAREKIMNDARRLLAEGKIEVDDSDVDV